jgi:hypothetical protein
MASKNMWDIAWARWRGEGRPGPWQEPEQQHILFYFYIAIFKVVRKFKDATRKVFPN